MHRQSKERLSSCELEPQRDTEDELRGMENSEVCNMSSVIPRHRFSVRKRRKSCDLIPGVGTELL